MKYRILYHPYREGGQPRIEPIDLNLEAETLEQAKQLAEEHLVSVNRGDLGFTWADTRSENQRPDLASMLMVLLPNLVPYYTASHSIIKVESTAE